VSNLRALSNGAISSDFDSLSDPTPFSTFCIAFYIEYIFVGTIGSGVRDFKFGR